MFNNAHEFYLHTVGKNFDIDGYYGAQCWDLFAYFCKEMDYPIINCTDTGYVIDIHTQRERNGLLNHFAKINNINDIQDGDWCVFGNYNETPQSHIAMFRVKEGTHKGIFLGQNQGSLNTNQTYFNLNGIVGIYRPKAWIQRQFPTSGHATVLVDVLNVRDSPSTKGDISTQYFKGEEFNYLNTQTVEGYLWAHYISYTGNDRYVALYDLMTDEPYVKVD